MIVALWVLTPPIGGGTAYVTARLLRSDQLSERVLVPILAGLVGIIIASMEFSLLGPVGETRSMAAAVAAVIPGPTATWQVVMISVGFALVLAGWLARAMVQDADTAQRNFLLALGALVAFSAGGGKVELAIGPLLPLFESLSLAVPIVVILIGGGLGLLAGSWMAAPRMIKSLTQDYSAINCRPRSGICNRTSSDLFRPSDVVQRNFRQRHRREWLRRWRR